MSIVYSHFFGLRNNPFSLKVETNCDYLPVSHDLVLKRLVKDLDIVTGVICLLGSAGVGKSTFIKRIIAECKDQGCDYIFKDLSSSANDPSHENESHQKIVFLLDYAESVSDDVLEEGLAVVEKRNAIEHPVLLILIGSPDIALRLKTPRFESYQCLLAGTYNLERLNNSEVGDYLSHRLCLAEYSGETLFTEDAVKSITKFSKGIPRVINTLCANVLSQAGLNQCRVITQEIVDHSIELCILEENVLDTEESTKTQLKISDQHLNEALELPGEFVTHALQQVNQMLDEFGQTRGLIKPTSARPSETSLESQFNAKIELVFDKPIDLFVTKRVDSFGSDFKEAEEEKGPVKISDDAPVLVEAIDVEPILTPSHSSDRSMLKSATSSETSLEPQFNSKVELVFEKPIDLVVTKRADFSSSDFQEVEEGKGSLKTLDDVPVPVEAIDTESVLEPNYNSDRTILDPPELEEKYKRSTYKLCLVVVVLISIVIVIVIWLMEQQSKNQDNRNVTDADTKISVERTDELKPIHYSEESPKGEDIDSHGIKKLRPEKLVQIIIPSGSGDVDAI